MKIQLDLENKTIKVEEDVNLKKFMDFVKIILPDGMWKEYTLQTNVTINWTSNPIVINPYKPYYPEPYWPWVRSNSAANVTLAATSGTFNIGTE